MSEQSFSMVQECVDSYETLTRPDGSLEIRIVVPRRFAELWQVRLSELRATRSEIQTLQSEG